MTSFRSMAYRATTRMVLVLALAAAIACGGGGGGGGGGPTAPQPGVTFTPSGVSAPAVRLLPGGGSGNVLELQVRADALPAVYGVAFDLAFPSNLLRFDGFTEGGFLGQNGAQTSLQVAENPSGRLVVGYTRLGSDAGLVGGSGTMMTLRFTAIGPGGGNFTFSENRLVDDRADEIRGPAWGGGSVQVTF